MPCTDRHAATTWNRDEASSEQLRRLGDVTVIAQADARR
jgi:hypothetical protein